MERRIGEYGLGERLSQLPVGALVEASLPAEREPLALLLLPDDLSRHQRMWEALRREAAALRTTDHPGIVRVVDVEMLGRQLVVAYVRPAGTALAGLLAGGASFTVEQVAAQVQQIATTIAFAHRRGMAHGLLSPSAVFVAEDGSVSVVGLGLAVACDEAHQAATVRSRAEAGYLAPEQADGPLNQRTADGYALGALAFTLLTGAPPTAPVEDADIADASVDGKQSADPPDLAAVLRRQLARDPARRFTSGLEFATALHQALGLVPPALVTVPPRRPNPRPANNDVQADEPARADAQHEQPEAPPSRSQARPRRQMAPPPPARDVAQTEVATPAMRRAMVTAQVSNLKLLLILIVVNGGGYLLASAMHAPLDLAIPAFGVISLVVIGGIVYERRKEQQDARAGQVRRVTGGIRLVRTQGDGSSTYSMYVADGRQLYIERPLYDQLRRLSTGVKERGSGTILSNLLAPSGDYRTVDLTTVYTPIAGLIIEITNERGNQIYRHPKYQP